MMNHHLLSSAVLLLGVGFGATWGDEKSAVAVLEKYGYRYVRDDTQPGKPVIEVRISGCDLKEEVLRQLVALKQLRSLTINTPGEHVDVALRGLTEFKKLQHLNLRGCTLTNFSTQQIGMLKELESLDIRLTGMTDDGLKHLGSLKQLQSLSINDEGVTDMGIKELAHLTQLQTLDLRGTKVGDAGLKYLSTMPHLQFLNLWDTKVTDAGLKSLTEMKQLRDLVLTDTKVSDAGVAELKKALPNCKIHN